MKDLKAGAARMAAEGYVRPRGLGITGKDGKAILNLIVCTKQPEMSKEEMDKDKVHITNLIQLLRDHHEANKEEEEEHLVKSCNVEEEDLEEGEIVDVTAEIQYDEE